MMGAVWSLLGILSGAFIAIQAPVNSQLARGLGLPVAAAAFSFLSGAIVLGIIAVAVVKLQGISLDWKAPAPWLFVGGGMLGGFLGVAVREISLGRVAGAVLLLAGALLIRLF